MLGNMDVRGAHRIRGSMAEDQVHVGGVQLLGRPPTGSLFVNHAHVRDIAPGRQSLLDEATIPQQSIQQAGKLFPVVWMPYRVQPDARPLGWLDRFKHH